MRRTLTAALLLTALTALTACAGPTEAESAYLAEMREQSSLIDIDEGRALDRGELICGVLADTKPGERRLTAGLLGRQGYPLTEVYSAARHLCPETGVRPSYE